MRAQRPVLAASLLLALGGLLAAADEPAAPEVGVQDAIAAALAGQPRLKAAESQLDAASARSRDARLNRIGDLTTTFLFTPEQKPLTIEFAGVPPYVPPMSFDVRQIERYSATAVYTLPIWTWGALASERAAARQGEEASRLALTRARQQTALEAARSFYQAAAAVAALSAAEQSLAQQRAFLDVATKRHEAGMIAGLDVLKAELGVTRAESDLVEAQNAERLAREGLVTVTSDERFRQARLAPLVDEVAELPEESEAVARALRQRPDLGSQARQAEAVHAAANALEGGRRPALAVRGQVTQQNAELGHVFRKSSQIYQAGLAVSWDLSHAWRGAAQVAEQRAAEAGLRHAVRAAEASAAFEVRAALSRANEARQRVRLQTRALEVAEEQARVARLAFGEGVITSVEAQDAELGLTAARLALLRARLDSATSLAELHFALGD